jgi:hypothetical protein
MILTELGILIGFQLFYDYKIITSLIDYSCLSVLLAESFLGLMTYFLPKNMSITNIVSLCSTWKYGLCLLQVLPLRNELRNRYTFHYVAVVNITL